MSSAYGRGECVKWADCEKMWGGEGGGGEGGTDTLGGGGRV